MYYSGQVKLPSTVFLAASKIKKQQFDKNKPHERTEYIIRKAEALHCTGMLFFRPRKYYAMTQEAYNTAHHELINQDRRLQAEDKNSSSSSSSSQQTPQEASQELLQEIEQASEETPSRQPPRQRPSEDPDEDQVETPAEVMFPTPSKGYKSVQVRHLAEQEMCNLAEPEFKGISPTAHIDTSLLQLRLQRSVAKTIIWVHADTHVAEDAVSRQIREYFWHTCTDDVDTQLIRHLYVGDMAGLLLALLPTVDGRTSELQRKANKKLNAVRKRGCTFLTFRTSFTEASEELTATGIVLPPDYIRMLFINAMETDPEYEQAMIFLLASVPTLI